jgi:hypothetical protein
MDFALHVVKVARFAAFGRRCSKIDARNGPGAGHKTTPPLGAVSA